ncbi:NAD-dependent epimerase/dehydratase family protein [Thermodesulfobacteriota bacterium]
MKIAIIGCGLNSDYHINFAKDYPGIHIIGVVDKDENRAQKCAERWEIRRYFKGLKDLVAVNKPDLVHVVTPPKTHMEVSKEAIELGCNVLIEKPLALNLKEVKTLFALADKEGVKICAVHNHFFDPCMIKARRLIESGKAGQIISVESHYGMNTWFDAFRKYPEPNVLPWIYDMPGGVFHDFMPHPLYVMLPFLGKVKSVKVLEKSLGELPQNISDELRIQINGEKAFGDLAFSFAEKPQHHFVRFYGTKMMIHVNFDTMTTVAHPVSGLPKAAQKATYNLSESGQLFTSTVSNVLNFLTGRLKPYQGMKELIHRYYDTIKRKEEPPVSKEEAINVIAAMDKIWPQIKNKGFSFDPIIPGTSKDKEKQPMVLVTGATGFVGKRLVEVLLKSGYRVRALARKLSHIDKLKDLECEIYFGDVGDAKSMKEIFKGVDFVVHAAADTAGDDEETERSTIRGTRNVIELCKKNKIKKLIYISSCSVYGVVDYEEEELVTEFSPLEHYPEKRGTYSYGKLKAEEIIRAEMEKNDLPIVCLRPGTVYGPGGEIFTPMMGFDIGNIFIIIGMGDFILPLVYIDNLIEAVLLGIEKDEGTGKIYNVVDPYKINKKQYMNTIVKRIFPKAKCIYFPYNLFYFIVYTQEVLLKALQRSPFITRYRLVSSQKNIIYSSLKIRNELGWRHAISAKNAAKSIIDYKTN